MERKGRGKLGKGAGKLPGRQRRCCCCRAPNPPAAAVDAVVARQDIRHARLHKFHSSGGQPARARRCWISKGRGRSSSSPSRDAGARCWRPGAALRRRRGGSSSPARAEAGCRRAADLDAAWGSRGPGRRVRAAAACGLCTWEGVGSRSKENGMVVSWAGPYPNWAETYPFVSFRPK